MKRFLSLIFVVVVLATICMGVVQAQQQATIAYCSDVCSVFTCAFRACYCDSGFLSTCDRWCAGDCNF
jgi:hypothetical protein